MTCTSLIPECWNAETYIKTDSKLSQWRSRTVEQLKSYIKKECERISLSKLSSVPKHILSVLKRKGDVTQW